MRAGAQNSGGESPDLLDMAWRRVIGNKWGALWRQVEGNEEFRVIDYLQIR